MKYYSLYCLLLFVLISCNSSKEKYASTLEVQEAEEVKSIPSWSYGETSVDKMTDTISLWASLESSNSINFKFPYDGGSKLTITLFKDKKVKKGNTSVLISVSKGQMKYCTDGECMMRVRFGKEKAEYIWGNVNNNGDTFFISNPSKFIKKLKSKTTFLLEPDFHNDYGQFEFTSDGLNWN